MSDWNILFGRPGPLLIGTATGVQLPALEKEMSDIWRNASQCNSAGGHHHHHVLSTSGKKDIMRERTTEKGTFLGWGQILFSILFHNWRFCRRLNSCSICYRDRHLVLSAGTTWIDRNLNDRTLSLNYAFEYKHQICPTRHWCFFCCCKGQERKGSGHLVTFV